MVDSVVLERVGDDAAVPTGKWLSSVVDDSVVSEQLGDNAAIPMDK